MKECIGECGNCGGRVMQHRIWHGVQPPPPARCDRCGWVHLQSRPVLPMKPPPPQDWLPSRGGIFSNYDAHTLTNEKLPQGGEGVVGP